MENQTDIAELDRRLGIAGAANVVEGNGGLAKVRIATPAASGEMYLHGAHVTSWKPVGATEVIFLSEHSHWDSTHAIRGGIPICFPWFRAKADNPHAPAHGFLRTRGWQLDAITRDGDAVSVDMSTKSDEGSREWWPGEFRAAYRVSFGSKLRLELTVTNTGTDPLRFEEALHTYHQVGDVESALVAGLDGVPYLDNTDSNREKTQRGEIGITGQTDNAYLHTKSTLELVDPKLSRRVRIVKENSLTTVVWNPWKEAAKSMSDFGDDEWKQMLCVEASNLFKFAVEIAPSQQHMLGATIEVAKL